MGNIDTCKKATSQLDGPPLACWDFNHFAALLAAAVGIVACVASEFYPPPREHQIGKTMVTYGGRCRACAHPYFDLEDEGEEEENEGLMYEGDSNVQSAA